MHELTSKPHGKLNEIEEILKRTIRESMNEERKFIASKALEILSKLRTKLLELYSYY